MGCGGSKLNNDEEKVPARLRPLLRRRFEEIRRRRNWVSMKKSASLSKKELLRDVVSDDDSSSRPLDFDEKSFSSQEDNLKVAPAPDSDETTTKTAKTDSEHDHKDKTMELKEPVPGSDSDESRKEKIIKQDVKDKKGKKMTPIVQLEPIKTVSAKQEEDDEDLRLSCLTRDCTCPGSPSFRVYFIESLDNAKEDDDEEDDSDKKSASEDSPMTTESENSETGSGSKTEKKGKIGNRLRRVIHKGRTGAIKNLLNVKSCYNPACTGHNNTRIVRDKPVA